jgi:hypothetical protein
MKLNSELSSPNTSFIIYLCKGIQQPFDNTIQLKTSQSDLSDGDFIVLELSADQLQLAQQVGHLSHSSILLSERIL